MVQTVVVKLGGPAEKLGRLRDVLMVDGRQPGAYAVVKIDDFSSDPGIFIVLTPLKGPFLQRVLRQAGGSRWSRRAEPLGGVGANDKPTAPTSFRLG